jgi:hypothetical protein
MRLSESQMPEPAEFDCGRGARTPHNPGYGTSHNRLLQVERVALNALKSVLMASRSTSGGILKCKTG